MTNPKDSSLLSWAAEHYDLSRCQIQQLPVEASTRKFWRFSDGATSWILMQSPPETENNNQFVVLSDVFRRAEVPVPQVIACDLDRGFLIVEDVGSQSFLETYQSGIVEQPMALAIATILRIQTIENSVIPLYTAARLYDELQIFRDYLCVELLATNDAKLNAAIPDLVDEIDRLPRCTVHRDFHCRNLLWRDEPPSIGVVDFQDALYGPVTYDLASLLFDCYWNHTPNTIESAVEVYWNQSRTSLSSHFESRHLVSVAIKFTAIQRLLKAAGIFVRLWLQKQQTTHLPYVIPTLEKAQQLCEDYKPLSELGNWLMHTVIPRTSEKLEIAT